MNSSSAPRAVTLPGGTAAPDAGPRAGLGRLLAPYRRMFAVPGARALLAANLPARLPSGMTSISAVVMISTVYGSYALAGAVTAVGLAATAIVGPWTGRLVDRYGQARVALPAAAAACLGSLALVWCVVRHAPAWTLFVAYVATATTPNVGGLTRSRWAHLLRGDPAALHTAYSWEQVVDETCFTLGPVLAVLLCTTVDPVAGTLTGALSTLLGVALICAQRRTQPPPATVAASRGRSPLRIPGIPVLLVTYLCAGVVFGAMEVSTVAFAGAEGHPSLAGAMVGAQALGSGTAGLLYGLRPGKGPTGRRFVRCVSAMAGLMTLPLLASAAGLPAVFACLPLAGAATAPVMVSGMRLLESRTPAGRLTEAMAYTVTCLLAGIGAGSAAGGRVVALLTPAGPLGAAYLVPAAAAGLAALVAGLGARRAGLTGRRGTDPVGPPTC
ncbi:MFS transporter [Streptomyces sp. NPDC059740]|uniref:MFS transporter n=1 Tax=Streptomyces sp. NPDC059740 TaxID=3346926 RepID=UPI00365E5098